MQLNTLLLTAVAFFTTSSYACKCVDGETVDGDSTRACCAQQSGNFVDGEPDCDADSISEGLSDFLECCQSFGYVSDCDFPDSILPFKE